MESYGEKYLERKLNDRMNRLGGRCLKLATLHHAGLPDRICLFPGGRLLFAEVKETGVKPTKLQLLIHSQLRALGFKVSVIDHLQQIEQLC